MKWFRHMTGTWEDEKIARLVRHGGPEGLAAYGLWWRVLEIVASRVDAKSGVCSVSYDVSYWARLLSLRGSHVRHWLEKLALTTLLTAEWTGSEIRVTIPNLLKYRDEYTRKSGDPPDTKTEQNRLKEKIPSESKRTASPQNGSATTHGSRLTIETLPADWLQWSLGKGGMSEEFARREFEKFHDYFAAKPGSAGRKTDWLMTWHNWCREALSRVSRPGQKVLAAAANGHYTAPPVSPVEAARLLDEADRMLFDFKEK